MIEDAGAKVAIVEEPFVPLVEGLVEHVLVVGEWEEDEGFDAEPHWRAVKPDDILTLIYTIGHDRAAEGRPDRAPQPDGGRRRRRAARRLPGRLARDQLAAERPRRRAHRAPLPPDRLRDDDHDVPGPAPDRHLPAGGQADLVLRRPARVGEAQGRRRGQAGGRTKARRSCSRRGASGSSSSRPGSRSRRRCSRSWPSARRSCSRRCARRSGSTRPSWSTSAPRRRRATCSCSSTPSASRWPRSGG